MSKQDKVREDPSSYQVITIKEIEYEDNDLEESIGITAEEQYNDISKKIAHAKIQLSNLKDEQEKLLGETNEKIREEKKSWQEEKELERKKVEKEGFSAGFEAGKKEALLQYEKQLKEVNDQYKLAVADYHKIIDQHRQTIINLAMTTANKILDETLASNPEKFQNIITKVMNDLKDNETITIIVHPDNYQVVSEQREELEQLIDEDGLITLQMDQSLNEGDCIIRHRFGQIDASIDVQLQEIKTALKESVSEN